MNSPHDEICFTPKTARAFKTMYEQSASAGLESFVFEQRTFVTSYAKYLVEYLQQNNIL